MLKHLSPDDPDMHYGEIVLMICILSIVVTAPTGAILISITGTKLLTKTKFPQMPESEIKIQKLFFFKKFQFQFIFLVSSWRRPSIRSIAIEEEDDEEERADPEMAPDKNTLQNTFTNSLNPPPFTTVTK